MANPKTLEEYIALEEEILKEKIEAGEEYTMRQFEELEGEIREVLPDEGILVRENPLDFPASVQRKYFGASAEDWEFPDTLEDLENIPPGHTLSSYNCINPYTKEEKRIYQLIQDPPAQILTKSDIGDKILEEVFEGNPYAQIADLTKSQVTTLALLVPILGKEVIRSAYSDLIATLEKVSEARVNNGLEAFDLSFLD